MHHQRTVGHAEHFLEFARHKQNGHAVGGELFHEPVHFAFGADIDAARGFVEQQYARLERAPFGTVKTAGIDLAHLTEDALALFRRDNIGIVFQDFLLFPTMTALENVAIPLELAENPNTRNNAFDRAKEQLISVGLGDRLLHYPSQLSGGEQQRVAVARAFVASPKILLADEPTGNLDGETGKIIVDLLFELHERVGTTMLLISHDQTLATRCDRVVTLADGRIVDDHLGEGPSG